MIKSPREYDRTEQKRIEENRTEENAKIDIDTALTLPLPSCLRLLKLSHQP